MIAFAFPADYRRGSLLLASHLLDLSRSILSKGDPCAFPPLPPRGCCRPGLGRLYLPGSTLLLIHGLANATVPPRGRSHRLHAAALADRDLRGTESSFEAAYLDVDKTTNCWVADLVTQPSVRVQTSMSWPPRMSPPHVSRRRLPGRRPDPSSPNTTSLRRPVTLAASPVSDSPDGVKLSFARPSPCGKLTKTHREARRDPCTCL